MQPTDYANALAMNTNSVIPDPAPDAQSITSVVKKSGKITGYKLSGGQSVSKEEGVRMAKEGQIKGVGVATNQGTEYLRALPDGNESNNLGNLPTVTE